MENNMEITQKTKNRINIYDTTIPILGICTKELKLVCEKNICPPTFIAASFIIAKL
jgi:hypothetical protein